MEKVVENLFRLIPVIVEGIGRSPYVEEDPVVWDIYNWREKRFLFEIHESKKGKGKYGYWMGYKSVTEVINSMQGLEVGRSNLITQNNLKK